MSDIEFRAFPKIHRVFRDCIITEKIDGTNAAVGVTDNGRVYAQSRKRIITPEDDNFGFAAWVYEHPELRDLGPGLHFGEWWGRGIQRNYGLDDRRFSLFNVSRWGDDEDRPICCHVVPTLRQATFNTNVVDQELVLLLRNGSQAAPGFSPAEGVCVYHTASNTVFKATVESDDRGKTYGA